MRKTWTVLLAMLAACFCLVAGAAELKEGRDFRELNPPLAPDRVKIEVIEFFWYGCPHCFNLEPVLSPWVRKLPADVSFRRVPAVFPGNAKWALGARIYYTLEAMNLLDRLHAEVFTAYHVERKRLDDEKVLLEWLATKGVDGKAYLAAASSFGVQSRVRQAVETSQRAGMNGVPAVVVDGRYQAITPESYNDLLVLVDRLIDRARADRGRK
jgi:thiol:disulfide interchange protein DsbA